MFSLIYFFPDDCVLLTTHSELVGEELSLFLELCILKKGGGLVLWLA